MLFWTAQQQLYVNPGMSGQIYWTLKMNLMITARPFCMRLTNSYMTFLNLIATNPAGP
jgi:hypothetical protein